MRALATRLVIRLTLCLALAWVGWRMMGAIGLLLGGAASALVVVRPLLELANELRHLVHARVWRELEGRHYAYHGQSVQVFEDVSHCRWVRVADVRAIVGFTATEGALALTYPSGFCRIGEPAQAYLSDEALLVHLAKESDPRAIRFKHWAEREITFPARRKRGRLGIRLDEPDFGRDD